GRGVWKLALPPAKPKPPTGAIHGPLNLQVGSKATFTATGTTPNGGKLKFVWTLPGKPASATGAKVTFTPTKLGVRTITLKVTDRTGTSAVVTQAVRVRDTRKPGAHLSRIAAVGQGQQTTVHGSAQDAGGIRSVRVLFGDGTSAKARLSKSGSFTVHHTYRRSGRYQVRLRVTDRSGHTTTVSATARVT